MRNFKFVSVALILLLTLSVNGQEISLKDQEIGISISTLERDMVTLNGDIEPKIVSGLYFDRYFSNLSWITSLEYGNNVIEDKCNNCADAYEGKGRMKEFNISSGLRYTFLRQKKIFIKPFLESDLYYSNILYKGSFGGGFTGSGTIIDYRYDTYGIAGRAGLLIQPISRIALSIYTSRRSGFGNRLDRLNDSNIKIKGGAVTFLQVRLGYQF
jgi:hypothetical protein